MSNYRNLWQQIETIGYFNQNKYDSFIILTIDGETCHDQKTTADHFRNSITGFAKCFWHC